MACCNSHNGVDGHNCKKKIVKVIENSVTFDSDSYVLEWWLMFGSKREGKEEEGRRGGKGKEKR